MGFEGLDPTPPYEQKPIANRGVRRLRTGLNGIFESIVNSLVVLVHGRVLPWVHYVSNRLLILYKDIASFVALISLVTVMILRPMSSATITGVIHALLDGTLWPVALISTTYQPILQGWIGLVVMGGVIIGLIYGPIYERLLRYMRNTAFIAVGLHLLARLLHAI